MRSDCAAATAVVVTKLGPSVRGSNSFWTNSNDCSTSPSSSFRPIHTVFNGVRISCDLNRTNFCFRVNSSSCYHSFHWRWIRWTTKAVPMISTKYRRNTVEYDCLYCANVLSYTSPPDILLGNYERRHLNA